MRLRCCRASLLLSITLTGVFIIGQLCLQLWLEWSEDTEVAVHQYLNGSLLEEIHDVVMVWWTPFTGNQGSFLDCGTRTTRCFVTQDRNFREHPKCQMLLFYGSNFEVYDLPLPKHYNEYWALLHEESPKNVPLLSHKAALSLFSHTATFSRYSDVPLTLQYLRDIDSLTDSQYVVPLDRKNSLLQKLAPVLYIQSDCDTPLDRDVFVKQLMNYIAIDSYGSCLHNKDLPPSLRNPTESMLSDEFLHFVAQYKFTISFENSVCEDYITEKLWRPLMVGSIPIYLGSPTIKDWLPNNKSAILAQDFSSPRDLADYVLHLNANNDEYLAFLLHKEGIISNALLLKEMKMRQWSTPEELNYHFISHFECEMCRQAHSYLEGNMNDKVTSENVYNCPKPVSSLTGEEDPENVWVHQWNHGLCEASVLHDFVTSGQAHIKRKRFLTEVKNRLDQDSC